MISREIIMYIFAGQETFHFIYFPSPFLLHLFCVGTLHAGYAKVGALLLSAFCVCKKEIRWVFSAFHVLNSILFHPYATIPIYMYCLKLLLWLVYDIMTVISIEFGRFFFCILVANTGFVVYAFHSCFHRYILWNWKRMRFG